jgi:hypothetical protein
MPLPAAETPPPPEQGLRAGRVDQVLAALTIATMPLGSIAYESEGRSLLVGYSLIVGAQLIGHILLGNLARRTQWGPVRTAIRLSLVMLLAMFVPVLASGLQMRAIVAYVSFAGGTLAGLTIAAIWTTTRQRLGMVDVALIFFVTVTSAQLYLSGGDPSASVHQVEVTWGASNYVAGTLVVASLAVVARLMELRTSRWLWVVPALGFASALLTLSRGAAVSGAVGIMVLLWNAGRTTTARAVLRVSCIGLVFAAAEVFTAITEARSVGGYDPGQNIDARIELIRLAWEQFLSAPLTGTGWLALRDVADFGVPISFAHNVVLSFLQIGGLFGVVFLVVLARQALKGWRSRTPMFAAVAAALAMSLSDPFFEGGVGALVAWVAIGYAAFSPARPTRVASPVRPVAQPSGPPTKEH